MNQQEQWQLDGSAPELYQRYLVPAVTALWAADLIDRAALLPGERVLDVACGTGVVARMASARVGPVGRVAALDLNSGMLVVARSLPLTAGAAIEWHEGSALALPFPDSAFDVALCQLGLQFFPDRTKALQEMWRVLTPGGRLALNVFGPIERNPAANVLADALDRHVRPGAAVAKRAEHAVASTEQLRTVVARAGFQDIAINTVSKPVRYPSVADYVRIQLAATPLSSLVAESTMAERQRLIDNLIEDVGLVLAPYQGDGGLIFPQEVHCLLASRR